MLKFYTIKGNARLTSCVGSSLWLLEEIGEPYTLYPIDLQKIEHKSDSFLRLNPNGKVPCLDDDGYIIWESMAINYYMCRKYKPELLGDNIREQGWVDQWIQWCQSELEPFVTEIFVNASRPPEMKQPLYVQSCKYKIMQATILMDKELKNRKYFVEDKFTLADLIIACYAHIHSILHTDLSMYPNFARWYNSVIARKPLLSAKDKNMLVLS